MVKLLQINSSLNGAQGQSSQLAENFVNALLEKFPISKHTLLDLAQYPVPHLDGSRFKALVTPPEQRTALEADIVNDADKWLNDIKEATHIVIALPMYNFGIPSVLKAYFDHLARAGVSFRYTENGPVGMLEDKPVYVIAARGGAYEGTPMDTQSDYVKNFLSFLGLKDIRFIYAEGLNMGEEAKINALHRAQENMKELINAV